MPVTMPDTATQTFTVRPFATVPVEGNAADLLDTVLSQLEQDARAIAPSCFYDYDTQQISAVFQVEVDPLLGRQLAAAMAFQVFDEVVHCGGLAIVEGDDADLLP